LNSFCTGRFWRCYEALSVTTRTIADKNFTLWQTNPKHPSLHFKPLDGGFWSVRVGKHYRALGHRDGDEITWVWIGSHAEYDHLISSLKAQRPG
jgi:hypothetical protein